MKALSSYIALGALLLGVASGIPTIAQATTASSAQPSAEALSKITLRIGQNNGELEPIFRASGAFDGSPYQIKFSSFNNALDNYTALAAGNIDVSDSAVTTALQLQQSSAEPWTHETAPIKTLLLRVSDYPGSVDRYVVMAGSKSGITELTADNVRGKKFAYSPGANNYLVFLGTLKYLGLTAKDVVPVQLDTTANALALLSNSVDLVSGSIELYGAALDDGAKVIASSSKFGMSIQSGVLASSQSLHDPLKETAIRDFIARYIKFQNWFIANPDAAIAAYVNGRHFTPAQARTAWLTGRVACGPADAKAVADAQSVSNILYDAGAFKKKLDVSVDFDSRYTQLIEQTLAEVGYNANLQASLRLSAEK
ncbi:ABC transporter substrate-binding protein [Pseudomonas typographi]|uniref:ABC transporter substrate-binding protein n=1 Tax=Pseudomonas typographi TaxID=2715964 RepID=A0ABR7YXL8_9PSED|nr:ABC transporter substrate-binding protein [Pseudomonas typographi]MBD1551047.1 ABC transporter substrate-binding protein [Pseudomonas typographi]MBD1587960.1 ABC transporter substrate-binding protein [Pseudomonas typographi]MBD1597949.1 ABC transporter substrate-binding protein [Pseudomonas typographi]